MESARVNCKNELQLTMVPNASDEELDVAFEIYLLKASDDSDEECGGNVMDEDEDSEAFGQTGSFGNDKLLGYKATYKQAKQALKQKQKEFQEQVSLIEVIPGVGAGMNKKVLLPTQIVSTCLPQVLLSLQAALDSNDQCGVLSHAIALESCVSTCDKWYERVKKERAQGDRSMVRAWDKVEVPYVKGIFSVCIVSRCGGQR